MTSSRQQRLFFFLCMALTVGAACIMVLLNLRTHLIYFYTPFEITPALIKARKPFRLGGMVEEGSYTISLKTPSLYPHHCFKITDGKRNVRVQYQGILPSLFREGQGVIVEGLFHNATLFIASQLLAKHDENYMPPEVARKLKPFLKQRKNPFAQGS